MMILKGDAGKSTVVQRLVECAKSIAYVYYDSPLPFDSYFVSSEHFSVDELVKSIP